MARVMRGSDQVGPIKTLTGSRVVAFKFVVQLPGLAVLKVEDSVQTPTAGELLVIAAQGGDLVGEVPSKAPANIEAGVSAVGTGDGAVLGLGLIGKEFLQVAGRVEGVRPNKICLRRQTMPATHPQAGLQSMVDGIGRRLLLIEIKEIGVVAWDAVAAHGATRTGLSSNCRGPIRTVRSKNLGCAWLIDIVELKQLRPFRSHIAELQDRLGGELPLNVEVEILHVRRAQFAVGSKEVPVFAEATVHGLVRVQGGRVGASQQQA